MNIKLSAVQQAAPGDWQHDLNNGDPTFEDNGPGQRLEEIHEVNNDGSRLIIG